MTALDCNVCTCGYNSDRCCCRSEIDVKGSSADKTDDTCCGSFKKESECSNSSMSPNGCLSIICEASNCIYNEENKCHAEHVDISGNGADTSPETICATFIAR